MGIDRRALESLLYVAGRHHLGATVMIGRHGMTLRARTLRRIFAAFGRNLSVQTAESLRSTGFAELLLQHLGATKVDSIDASDYEGANLIVDMSKPIPAEWCNKYDTVCDFGTIEHIFNFPQAVANCLSLLKTSGLYLCLTSGNNYCGHGFYQFSPELWFSLFTANHCVDVEVFLIPTRPDPLWFKVADQRELRGRVEIINGEQLFVLAISRKTQDTPSELAYPRQSDYEGLLWQGEESASVRRTPTNKFLRGARAAVGSVLKTFGRRYIPAFGVSDHHALSRFNPAGGRQN